MIGWIILQESMTEVTTAGGDSGYLFGSGLAMVTSWQRNRSILWAMIAGFFSWLYVIYFALTRRDDER